MIFFLEHSYVTLWIKVGDTHNKRIRRGFCSPETYSLIREDKTHTCNFNKGRKYIIETEIPWKDNNEVQKIDILSLKSWIVDEYLLKRKTKKVFVEELSELIFDTTTFFSSYFLNYWASVTPKYL